MGQICMLFKNENGSDSKMLNIRKWFTFKNGSKVKIIHISKNSNSKIIQIWKCFEFEIVHENNSSDTPIVAGKRA
jgi:hypothetical protein